MSRPSLASSALPASRVTRARLRAASASRGSPHARAGGWDASLAIALAFARVLSIARSATFATVSASQRVPRRVPSVESDGREARETPAAATASASPAAAAAFVAARFLILSLGLLRLSTRRSKASVSAATAIACVDSHGVQASHALRAADASAGAPRLVSSRQAVTRCVTRFGANLCQRAVVHASAHTVARTPGGGPPSRRDSVHPRRR